jgi:hypothetical protein
MPPTWDEMELFRKLSLLESHKRERLRGVRKSERWCFAKAFGSSKPHMVKILILPSQSCNSFCLSLGQIV